MVVDDDPPTLMYLRIMLAKNGFNVSWAESAKQAREKLYEIGCHHFDCVVTDHRMPNETGLDLLHWLHSQEPTLAAIIATADGQKTLVTESLRGGAVDFLEKPLSAAKLIKAVHRAVEMTRQRRHQARSETAVKDLGQTQLWMVQVCRKSGKSKEQCTLDICFHPKQEAGGDFISRYQPSPGIHSFLLSDVSGHDLQAAYISAYFQGIVRGMLQCATPVSSILNYFNSFLVDEWNGRSRNRGSDFINTSLAVSAVTLDFNKQIASVNVCGAPAPAYIQSDGRITQWGQEGGACLGWFGDIDSTGCDYAFTGGSRIWIWTDGLAELALERQVHPLCIAYLLEYGADDVMKSTLLAQAQDDIMLADIEVPSLAGTISEFLPIDFELYRGDQLGEIDEMVSRWNRHLAHVIPTLSEELEHDILLACREAVINALKHGCEERADRIATFQISLAPQRNVLRVWVEDPGPGHQFDFIGHCGMAGNELSPNHRGLMFMMNLATSVKLERNGARVIMDFELSPATQLPDNRLIEPKKLATQSV